MRTNEDCEMEIASRIYIACLTPEQKKKECRNTLMRLRKVQKNKALPYNEDEYKNRYLFICGYKDNIDVRCGFNIQKKDDKLVLSETFTPTNI